MISDGSRFLQLVQILYLVGLLDALGVCTVFYGSCFQPGGSRTPGRRGGSPKGSVNSRIFTPSLISQTSVCFPQLAPLPGNFQMFVFVVVIHNM